MKQPTWDNNPLNLEPTQQDVRTNLLETPIFDSICRHWSTGDTDLQSSLFIGTNLIPRLKFLHMHFIHRSTCSLCLHWACVWLLPLSDMLVDSMFIGIPCDFFLYQIYMLLEYHIKYSNHLLNDLQSSLIKFFHKY